MGRSELYLSFSNSGFTHIFSPILRLQGVILAAEQGRMLQNYSVSPGRCLKCRPFGLVSRQAFSSTRQVSGTFSLLSLKQSDFVWPCKRPSCRGLRVTREFLEMNVECQIWLTTVILLQYSWRLRMPEMPEDVVVFWVIIWIGLRKSWNWGCDSVRLAGASVSCWGAEFLMFPRIRPTPL